MSLRDALAELRSQSTPLEVNVHFAFADVVSNYEERSEPSVVSISDVLSCTFMINPVSKRPSMVATHLRSVSRSFHLAFAPSQALRGYSPNQARVMPWEPFRRRQHTRCR
jgi:hypothetical protein